MIAVVVVVAIVVVAAVVVPVVVVFDVALTRTCSKIFSLICSL